MKLRHVAQAGAGALLLSLASGAALAADVTIKIATAYPPGNESAVTAEKFAELLGTYSDGRIEGKVFLGGAMGGERENIQAVKLGSIQASTMGSMPIHMLTPEYSFMDSPFVMRGEEHWLNAWNGKIGDGIRDILKKNRLRVMGIYYRGFRHTTADREIKTADDIRGVKMRVPQAPSFTTAWKAVGAATTVVPLPELFTALQTGVAEASEGPASQLLSYRLNEVQDYLVMTGHMITMAMMIVNEPFLEGLSDTDRAIVEKAAKEATAFGDAHAKDAEKKLIQKLIDGGMTRVEPDRDSFRKAAMPAVKKLFEEQWTATTLEEVNAY